MPKLSQMEGVKRADIFHMPPQMFFIVTDPEHSRYDAREKLPVPEWLVLNIMEFGVKKNIIVAKKDGNFEVVDGRQRVKAALEANKRLKRAGGTEIRIGAVFESGSDADIYSTQIIANEMAQTDGILAKLVKVNRLRAFKKTTEEIANTFGVSKAAIGQWEKLNDCCPEVIDAVDAGTVPASAAAALSGLKVPDQKAKLASLVASGGRITAKAAKKAAKGDSSVDGKRISTATIKMYRDDSACPEDVRDVLAWVLGESSKAPFELSRGDVVNGL